MKKLIPGVYLFKHRGTIIYIGHSSNVPRRSKKRDKGHKARWSAIRLTDSIHLIPCASLLKAKQLEELLILKHRPQFNIQIPHAPADIKRTEQIIRNNW